MHRSRDSRGSISLSMHAITMQDDLGIVYLIDSPEQFWSELEDILTIPSYPIPTLDQLDLTLRRSLSLCAAYHEQYLADSGLDQACQMLLNSELFQFHSERMLGLVLAEARENTDPHFQFISLHVLLCYGRRKTDFFRVHSNGSRWEPLLPFLMDHIMLEIDEQDIEDVYAYMSPRSALGQTGHIPVPIEAKLRSLSVALLYEMCRVQKWSLQDLKIFSDPFLDHLFDLVEQTRLMQDDTFNYSVIKLIVALNEQFMVASLAREGALDYHSSHHHSSSDNRVLRVLMRRLGSSKTFGENMIFMLNRNQRTEEDLCTTLLVLKLLYLLFTNKGTEEYFYTNDLCVLVDVFLRELSELDEEGSMDGESLRHTYLRVLHPLLTKTQLRSLDPSLYKRPQVISLLEGLINVNRRVRDEVNPTTRRLVERCLGGLGVEVKARVRALDDVAVTVASGRIHGTRSHLGVIPSSNGATQTLKSSRSMEFKKPKPRDISADNIPASASAINFSATNPRSPIFNNAFGRRGSNASQASATSVAHASAPPSLHINVISPTSPSASSVQSDLSASSIASNGTHGTNAAHPRPPKPPRRQGSGTSTFSSYSTRSAPATVESTFSPSRLRATESMLSGMSLVASPEPSPTKRAFGSSSASSASDSGSSQTHSKTEVTRRSAPPPPIQAHSQSHVSSRTLLQASPQSKIRRKPPAIPLGYARKSTSTSHENGVIFTAIKSSSDGHGAAGG